MATGASTGFWFFFLLKFILIVHKYAAFLLLYSGMSTTWNDEHSKENVITTAGSSLPHYLRARKDIRCTRIGVQGNSEFKSQKLSTGLTLRNARNPEGEKKGNAGKTDGMRGQSKLEVSEENLEG